MQSHKYLSDDTLIYIFDVWVCFMGGQDTIMGRDFMIPSGIRLDLADGTLYLHDGV